MGMNEVLRQEKKYFITAAEAPVLCSRLGRVMMEDPHNGPQGYSSARCILIP